MKLVNSSSTQAAVPTRTAGLFRSKGVWTAAYVHGVNNSIVGYLLGMVYLPASTIFSFGVGVYGIVFWMIAIGLILLDPVWKEKD
jgi:hypothetical protein